MIVTSTLSILGTVVAAHAGVFDFVLQSKNVPLINGTIINNDNKTYSILIVPTGKQNVTIPVPVPTETPTINNTVNNTIPNPVNVTPPTPINVTPPAPTPIPIPAPIPVPVPTPTPTPVPTKDVKVIMVGDVENSPAGVSVFNAIKAKNPDVVAVLGDLGYAENLAWFKSTYGTLNQICVPGNHDTTEDETAALEKETLNYCSNPFFFKLNGILFIGINTSGNLDTQLGQAQEIVMNPNEMNGVKEVHLLTHKPCAAPPNSHHVVEAKVKTFCDSLKAKIPSGVKFFSDNAHNHVMSASADGVYKAVGSGGRSHYTCGTSTAFPFCDNVHYGYLEYTFKTDGTSSYHFYDFNGKEIKQQ
jgi:predicted phosphodiesterase